MAIIQNSWPALFKSVIDGLKKQGKAEKLSQMGGTKETESQVESWMGFWDRKRTLVEKLMKSKWCLQCH